MTGAKLDYFTQKKLCTIGERERKNACDIMFKVTEFMSTKPSIKRQLKARNYWMKAKQLKNRIGQFILGRQEEALVCSAPIKLTDQRWACILPSRVPLWANIWTPLWGTNMLWGMGGRERQREIYVLYRETYLKRWRPRETGWCWRHACHLGTWCSLVLGCCRVCAHGPTAAVVGVDVHGFWYYQGPWECLGLGLPHVAT